MYVKRVFPTVQPVLCITSVLRLATRVPGSDGTLRRCKTYSLAYGNSAWMTSVELGSSSTRGTNLPSVMPVKRPKVLQGSILQNSVWRGQDGSLPHSH